MDDLVQYLDIVQQRLGGQPLPTFLGGQSLGGLTVAHTVLRMPADRFAGIILYSAALNVVWTPVLK